MEEDKRNNVSPEDQTGESAGQGSQPSDETTGGEKTPSKAEVSPEVENLRVQLGEKDKEIVELKDKYLRALAETENIRKRLRQQSEESIRLQRENMLRDMLPIVDDLERAVGAAQGGGNGKSIVEGVQMVLRSMLDLMKSYGVVPVSAVGQPFNPQLHEAVDHVESAEHSPNTVITEFNKGYLIGDRMLRPARVTVSKQSGNSGKNGGDNGGSDVENG